MPPYPKRQRLLKQAIHRSPHRSPQISVSPRFPSPSTFHLETCSLLNWHDMTAAYGDLRHLLPDNYKRLITSWLEEDCPSLDYGGFVVGESEGEARLLGKSKVRLHL